MIVNYTVQFSESDRNEIGYCSAAVDCVYLILITVLIDCNMKHTKNQENLPEKGC